MTLKQRIKFFFQGKPYLKIITIILSAAAFAFCSIGSTGFTTSRIDCLTDAILNIPNYTNQATPGVTVIYDHDSDNAIAKRGCLSQGVLDILEKNISSSYLYGYHFSDGNIGIRLGVSFGGDATDVYDYMQNTYGDATKIDSSIVAGSQSAMEDWGFSLVAGSYPKEPNQVAICEEAYDIYKEFGYVCATNLYNYTQEEQHGYWSCARYEDSAEIEVMPINSYSDIIGKTLVFLSCDDENGTLGEDAVGKKCELEIVGIINTGSGKEVEGSNAGYYVIPAYKLYVSESWREAYLKKDGEWTDTECTYLYVVRPDSYSAAREIASACVKATDYVEKYNGDTDDLTTIVAPHFLETVLVGSGYPETFALIGGLLGAIAVALQFFAVNVSFNERRKQIGVLQSLGAGRKKLAGIFIPEVVATSLCTFILATPMAYGVFYGYIYEATYNFKYLVHRLVYSPVNLLILAALCFVLPMIVSLVSIFRFLKRAPIDNIQKRDNKLSHTDKKRERYSKKD